MKLGLNGKTAFVAASSDGIGRAIAEGLAAEGCKLLLCSRREEKLARVRAQLQKEYGADIEYLVADLDSAAQIDRVIDTGLSMHGGFDILVTNNGGPPPGTFADTKDETWELGWNRTFMSAVRLIRGFLPAMEERGWGRIINVTSISVKQPVQRLLLSNSYRAAVTGMARTLSDEVASRGITVNNIAPGYISTDRTIDLIRDRAEKSGRNIDEEREAFVSAIPAARTGDPADIAHLACFLASDLASYITGTTIQVDGGLFRGLM